MNRVAVLDSTNNRVSKKITVRIKSRSVTSSDSPGMTTHPYRYIPAYLDSAAFTFVYNMKQGIGTTLKSVKIFNSFT